MTLPGRPPERVPDAEFDRAFVEWWIEDQPPGGFPERGEWTPHDDLTSFKAMLSERGWTIVAEDAS